MSGRIVRASKYRHVHGDHAKPDKCYLGGRFIANGDGNNIKANKTYFAVSAAGGGGPVLVHLRSKVGRFDANPGMLNVHRTSVLDTDFSPFMDNLIATGAEDGTLRITLLPEDGLTKDVTEAAASLDGHGKKVSLLHFHPTANNILGSSSYDLTLRVWDIVQQRCALQFEFPDVVQSFEWNSNGSLIGVTCKDKTVKIYDPRASAAVQTAAGLAGGKMSKLAWLDNVNKLAVVGFSQTSTRQFAVYDPRNFSAPINVSDIDQGAGVMLLHYDPDTSMLYMAGKGDANIRYFEATNEEPYLHFLSDTRTTDSQKGVCFLPKSACDTSICEVAIALRFLSDKIVPVSFQVPRKSDTFQADIFPDFYAGVPALTESEWLAGQNKEPVKKSWGGGGAASAPKSGGPSGVPSFVPQKSAAELQRELNAANERIKELEAQVAALKAK